MEKVKTVILQEVVYLDTILEEVSDGIGNKQAYLLLNNMVADKYNANKRRYPLQEVQKALPIFESDVKEGLGSALMLADHPLVGIPPSVKDSAALIKEVYLDDETKIVKTKALLLDTTQGKNILAIVKAGGKIGVSSRGSGTLIEVIENGEVFYEVKDFKLKGFDFVVFPSLGAEASSEALVYEQLQEEIHKIFPNLVMDLQDIKENIEAINKRISSDDLDKIKSEIIETIIKSDLCSCNNQVSDVFINMNNNNSNEHATLEKEEVDLMKTLKEFQEQYPELYKEFVDTVTVEVTESVTKDVTEKVTIEVTEKVTKEVTESVALEVKEALTKELAEEAELKVKDAEIALAEANQKITELESDVANIKEETKPYIDILEGLTTFMREKKILITEDEVIKVPQKEEAAPVVEEDANAKILTDEMTTIISEQKSKLDEALTRITALETENKKLSEEKLLAEAETKKAEIQAAIADILAKEPKYAGILKDRLEAAESVEDVTKIYEQSKLFIDTIEKVSRGEDVPAGIGKVVESEVIAEDTPLVESEASVETKRAALKEYQRKLAGIVISK
jgi:hypothetical protein